MDNSQSDITKNSTPPTITQQLNLIIIILVAFGLFNIYTYVKIKRVEAQVSTAPSVAQQQVPNQQPPQPTQDLTAMPEVKDKDHIRGNKDADVVLVEYSDYECPFCKKFHPTMQQVMQEYGDKVAWVYRHYPLNFHPKAQKTAEATECAAEQGGNDAFWKMSDAIFEKMPDLELSQLSAVATEIGLDATSFQSCLDSGKYAEHIKGDQDGATKAGISGTPGTVIVGKNGKRDFVGGALPFEGIKTQIDAVLK